jgi:hypothetical protein
MLLLRMVEERFHRDDEGRPIREGRTPAEFLKEGEIEYRQCPYSGSRYLHKNPMNVSALRQMSAHWDELIDGINFQRDAYRHARGEYRADLMDIWRVGQIGSAMPWFFILKRGETCPAWTAALSKATLGIGIWGARVLIDQVAAGTFKVPGPRWTEQEIYDTSDANDTLIAEDEVCAASDKMMLKFYEPYVAELPFRGTGDTARLPAMRDDFIRFSAHYVAFKQWIWMYWLARRFIVQDLQAITGPRPEYEEHLDPSAEPPDFFLLERERPTELPLAHRLAWFASLGALVEPFCPDGSDAPYRIHAARLAQSMGEERSEPDPIARLAGRFTALDELHAQVIATTEAGFGGDTSRAIDHDVRDRVLRTSPRALFSSPPA